MIKPVVAILITLFCIGALFKAARAFDWAVKQNRYVDFREWVWKILE